MLSLQLLRQDPERVIKALAKRNIDARPYIKSLLEKNEKRRKIQNESETLKAESNKIAKTIGNLVQEGKTNEIQKIKIKSKSLKTELTKLAKELIEIEFEEKEILLSFPNIPHESVKKGKGEEENEIIKSWGDLKSNPNSLPHWELSEKYNLIDFERGVKVTGAGFPVYTGKGARLQRALIQYFLDTNTESGYK